MSNSHFEPVEILVLSAADVRAVLPMSDCIDLISRTMSVVSAGGAELPLRTAVSIPGSQNKLGIMQGYLSDPPSMGTKVMSLFPDNPSRGYSSHMGVVSLFEPQYGRPLALISGAELTAIRTAAASGAATRVLARADAGDLAILGTGAQAAAHLEAMSKVRQLHRIRIWGRSLERAAEFARARTEHFDCKVEVAPSVQAAVDGADLVCTTTAAKDPILRGEWLKPGVHVNLVGSSVPQCSEVDDELVRRARYFVDYRPSAHAQAGELLRAAANGRVTLEHIVGEIGQVISGQLPGRRSDEEITVYKSLGIIAQDLASAAEVYRRARAAHIGTKAFL